MFFDSQPEQTNFFDLSTFIRPSIISKSLTVSSHPSMNWFPPHKVIIQGITEYQAAFSATQMKAYGADIVAAISPGHGGKDLEGIPVFDLVEQAKTQIEQIDISLLFVQPYQVLDAGLEAIAAGIRKIVICTPQVPPLDTIELIKRAQETKTQVLGPGSHGLVVPQQLWLGNLQPQFYQPGKVGLITSSKHLCYEVAAELNHTELGESIIVSLGNERITASDLLYWVSTLNDHSSTEAIVVISHKIDEIAQLLALSSNSQKPLIVYIAGLKVPQEKVYRDAITIISNHLSASIPAVNRDRQIINKLKKIGIQIAKKPSQIPSLIQAELTQVSN